MVNITITKANNPVSHDLYLFLCVIVSDFLFLI